MDDELNRLRDVARAAAALLRAEEADEAHAGRHIDTSEEQWTMEIVQEAARLAATVVERQMDLAQALGRLAEMNPELVNE